MAIREVKLGKVATVKGGKRLPKGINLITKPNPHPYIRVRDLNGKKTLELDGSFEFVDDETQKAISRYIVTGGDIVLSIVGTIGLVSVVGDSLNEANLTENCVKLTSLSGIDRDYLYYYLKSSYGQQEIARGTVGAVQAKLPIKNIQDISIPLPDEVTQRKIADILSSLDAKIEVNQRINDNLQQQLFSLYENMATASPCLKEYTLSNLCDFQEGYVNPPQTHPEYFDGEVKWLRAVDINESFIIETSRTLTKAGFESAKKSALLFEPNTIAISKSGTIGRLGIIADYMCGNRAVINIAPHDTNMLAFIYCFLKSKQREFPDMAVGSVQKNLYVSLLEPLSVSIPDNESLTAFNAVGASILGMIHNNCVENTDLANLRDTILPKLMSGEIDVSSVLL